jgi:hypothetical protein
MREKLMKKESKSIKEEILAEYDFTKGVRGKYTQEFQQGTNIVVLSPDVAEVFTDSEAVNEALRMLIQIARREKNATIR